jgi:hypothetical protein
VLPRALGDSRSEIKEEGRRPGGHSRRELPNGLGQCSTKDRNEPQAVNSLKPLTAT